MSFDPSGLPTLPNCESDINRWASDLQTWLVSKLTVAHNEIDAVVVDPFDICTELGNLAGPTCLVPATGIDQSGFTFAEETETVVPGSGILPWPGSVLGSLSVITDYRTGEWEGTADYNWNAHTVTFSPALAHNNYVVLEERDHKKFFLYIGGKSTTSFNIQVATPNIGEEYTVKFRYYLLLLPESS